jgi:hypothetical protein
MEDKNKEEGPQTPEPRQTSELAPMIKEQGSSGPAPGFGSPGSPGSPDGPAFRVAPPPGSPGSPDGPPFQVAARARVSLTRSETAPTADQSLWAAIRNGTDAIRGERYEEFIRRVLCEGDLTGEAVCLPEDQYGNSIQTSVQSKRAELIGATSGYGVDAYNLLKYATQAFLLLEAGVVIRLPRYPLNDAEKNMGMGDIVSGEESRTGERATFRDLEGSLEIYLGKLNGPVPYLQRVLAALELGFDDKRVEPGFDDRRSPFCKGALTHRFSCPSMLELIWSYWHEEGMLVQTMNAICMRFQNRRGPFERDPLANLEIDPLRPLNNLLWGYIQDEYNRLTVPRRAYEYDHHYGLKIVGKAVPELRSADSRSKFIEAFHNLLYRTAGFYREDADTTVIADGFSLLSSLREVHLLLAEGAHNQFGDLPWTSRAEMLMMQWMLGRPEMREFLRGRAMVPYSERWMGQVDTMKKLQGWTDTTITHFRNLAVYGEQILLSIRYGDWSEINEQDFAKNWARYWRPEIQGYIHAYLAATGVDLSDDIVDTRGAPARYVQPSSLLEARLLGQGSRGELPPAAVSRTLTAGAISFGALPAGRRRALNPARKE